MKRQVYNPYLPLDRYIPDGEPHVFGDRVYVYGSHDKEGGNGFCLLDYEVFSAPLNDLTDWRSEGISYRASQDPDYSAEKYYAMYAPDVVQGNDGRFYLYYAMSGGCFTGPIHVAVSDSPAGPFNWYGCVRKPDGTPFSRNITFDPAVINDEGTIRLYYGWSLSVEEDKLPGMVSEWTSKQNNTPLYLTDPLVQAQKMLFDKSEEEIRTTPEGIMGANVVELENDMLTVRGTPKRIVPGQFSAMGTSFEHHAFFEASSIRKIDSTYYFIYSSQLHHELCYATSRYPDREFVYGGVIISNGDIGYQGRLPADRVAMTGNNHGSIANLNGVWYIFYHRQTHKNCFSRQGCAERITILPDGSVPQVEMTSCGLNGTPLKADGTYSAFLACNLSNGKMCDAEEKIPDLDVPYLTNDSADRFATQIGDGTIICWKYFSFDGESRLTITLRGKAKGTLTAFAGDTEIGCLPVNLDSAEWQKCTMQPFSMTDVRALRLIYHGSGHLDLREVEFSSGRQ